MQQISVCSSFQITLGFRIFYIKWGEVKDEKNTTRNPIMITWEFIYYLDRGIRDTMGKYQTEDVIIPGRVFICCTHPPRQIPETNSRDLDDAIRYVQPILGGLKSPAMTFEVT